jgi:hypothetical protein
MIDLIHVVSLLAWKMKMMRTGQGVRAMERRLSGVMMLT